MTWGKLRPTGFESMTNFDLLVDEMRDEGALAGSSNAHQSNPNLFELSIK